MNNVKHQANAIAIAGGNAVITEPWALAQRFTSYFVEVTGDLTSKQQPANPENHDDLPVINNNGSSFLMAPTDPTEVRNAVLSLNNTKSVGLDLPVALLKQSENFIAEPLADITNTAFSSGQFPTALKLGK